MKKNKSELLFNIIAPIYGLFFNSQKKHYKSIINKVVKDNNIFQGYNSMLDVGCGTGALAAAFKESGFNGTGTDQASLMLKIARRKTKGMEIDFVLGDVGERLPFDNESFDFVMASYVAHGMKVDERRRLYKEMKRVARYLVVFHDYNDKKRVVTSVIEWFERGDYFNFIKSVPEDFKSVFSEVEVLEVNENAAWYVCKL